jgi:hypothetical protein
MISPSASFEANAGGKSIKFILVTIGDRMAGQNAVFSQARYSGAPRSKAENTANMLLQR